MFPLDLPELLHDAPIRANAASQLTFQRSPRPTFGGELMRNAPLYCVRLDVFPRHEQRCELFECMNETRLVIDFLQEFCG